jgi:hypothetical protein
MSRSKLVVVIGVVLILIVVSYIYFGGIYMRKQGNNLYSTFNSSDLNGEIERVYVAYKGIAFKLTSDSSTYVFYPITGTLNNNQIFNSFAEKGDRIIKPAYSDTLKLVKGDKVYLYTFQKIE